MATEPPHDSPSTPLLRSVFSLPQRLSETWITSDITPRGLFDWSTTDDCKPPSRTILDQHHQATNHGPAQKAPRPHLPTLGGVRRGQNLQAVARHWTSTTREPSAADEGKSTIRAKAHPAPDLLSHMLITFPPSPRPPSPKALDAMARVLPYFGFNLLPLFVVTAIWIVSVLAQTTLPSCAVSATQPCPIQGARS